MKTTPQFTWFRRGVGAEQWGADTRSRVAAMLRVARARRNCGVMALIRTR